MIVMILNKTSWVVRSISGIIWMRVIKTFVVLWHAIMADVTECIHRMLNDTLVVS